MKILFLVPYPLKESPSQRFRFEQYFEVLKTAKHSYRTQSFLDSRNWQYFFKSGRILAKSIALIKGFLKRFLILFVVPRYDRIFIHREATPVGPPIIEWIITNLLRKKIIYDFDDAIWLTDKTNESNFEKFIRWREKVRLICKWSYKISAGNEYLCEYALQFNLKVVYNPTTIETDQLHNPDLIDNKKSDSITIGWTGSHSTLKYLKEVEPALISLEKLHQQVEVLIIANQKPELKLQSMKFLPWRKESETADLAKIDIGIMPLPDDEWTKGKCGFKALQYMAMEIPTVVSPVGANTSIVDHGINGFLSSSMDEWVQYLSQLCNDKSLRTQMGRNGRQKVINQFSVDSNKDNFLSLFL